MENLQGPINSSSLFLGEQQQQQQQQLDVEYCLQQGFFSRFQQQQQQEQEEYDDDDELEEPYNKSSLEDKVPFLQMLQSIESQPLKEPNFQTLMRIQQLENENPWEMNNTFIQQLELESCITHEVSEFNSPIKHSTSSHEGVSSESNQEQPSSSKPSCKSLSPVITTRERRKRKRTRTTKNKEEIENQRMTHITVERNRRRQMNDHLNSIRSLMPPTYIQRGDQASIIGGAINFVKELEQLLQSLEAQKRTKNPDDLSGISSNTLCASPSSPNMHNNNNSEMGKAENKSKTADIEVTVIQSHVNMKIECQKKPCQLLKVIVSLEELRLTVLHLNITSSQHTVLYSFNLKIEEECRLKSADEIAAAVHQMFS